ncbi:hypothetical protein ABB37_10147 [Leptomonas pyrrhocoris]|uniref:Chromo domain-containing protein n=1 Tax=Leptomonas pyrrhocoris TaxID=157538 RepID=A0A0M9FP05_LEPPY|nr:hypothetical protein ABB37_10147 [Leptomonas pyrrhocoris]KPA73067.1 hypothetical protein ABB37_10147 [Leptomonas pyrrhocoris]|eukprot:XP_015651506.1 hypothetical protein ABB37_10147 [Leptomonas pyrrhocoris]
MELRSLKTWSRYLPLVQRIINATPHAATMVAPSRLLFGSAVDTDRQLLKPISSERRSVTVEDYVQELIQAQESLIAASQDHQDKVIEERLSQSAENPTEYAAGDYVVVSYPDRPPSKLAPRWRGPLIIADRVGSDMYQCQDLVTHRFTDFHVSRLKKYNMDMTPNPVEVAQVDNDEWKVEQIVDHKGLTKKAVRFRVRWEGFEPTDDTWLPYSECRDLEALDVYLAAHPELRL